MFSSQVTLSLFFLYIVIISEKFFDLISCRLQKVIIQNLYVKHIFILLNIFLFTFILGWYTEFSIYDAKSGFTENFNRNNLNKKEKLEIVNSVEKNETVNLFKDIIPEGKIIIRYFFYSFLIYIIFLLTTKCQFEFLVVFLALTFLSFIIFILKTYSKTKGDIQSSFSFFKYISKKEKQEMILQYLNTNENVSELELRKKIRHINTNYLLTNIETTVFIISLTILIIGFIIYFKRIRKEHPKDFNMLKFIFGKYCKTIHTHH